MRDYVSKIKDVVGSIAAVGGLVAVLNSCATVNSSNQPSKEFWRVCSPIEGITARIDYIGNGTDYLCACGKASYSTLGTDDSADAGKKILADKLGNQPAYPMVLEVWDDEKSTYSVVCVPVSEQAVQNK
ncbi:MAG: hypothetical protein V1729_03035 [Candidatus Woesearchaeota archaeon]